ncbi:unnamed protein product [Sphenostylis stenocarpa]|uniref:MRN complex-interacting protein N-terminal domain-containing protein n=1 Tax=Sphenostylis stenocarpa TaxID=92480 RepID=A0AA86SDP0_9FABA|nr:unnamed protein product [Sphenostylis stenocarpa]
MSTLFIALQCCQCSTMQVKQKKKCSNKWNCAICNQKQSVRRVFAQGFMAKDVRKFVQDFNMSRKSIDDGEWPLAETLDPSPEIPDGEVNLQKKRTDWSAYLDQEDHHTLEEPQQDHDGDDCEPLVVTELQKGMFKKRRVVEETTAGSDKFFNRSFVHNSQEEPLIARITSLTENNVKRNNYVENCKPTSSKVVSKWKVYMTEYNDNVEFELKKNMDDHSDPWNINLLETIPSEKVEDDIHPDFI